MGTKTPIPEVPLNTQDFPFRKAACSRCDVASSEMLETDIIVQISVVPSVFRPETCITDSVSLLPNVLNAVHR
jgi:hypothetical protein